MIIEYPEAKNVVISGDIHEDFNTLVYKLCIQHGYKDTLLIVAGDCGFGFNKQGYYQQIYNKNAGRLKKANNWIAFVRGNHDDPSYFNEQKITYTRWRTIPDYAVIKTSSHSILCVGGAISLDRSIRLRDRAYYRDKETSNYWQDEGTLFSPEKIDEIKEQIHIDTLVTHAAPSFCKVMPEYYLKEWEPYDTCLPEDVRKDRENLDNLYKYLKEKGHKINEWFCGHYHKTFYDRIDNTSLNVLSILELRQLKREEDTI